MENSTDHESWASRGHIRGRSAIGFAITRVLPESVYSPGTGRNLSGGNSGDSSGLQEFRGREFRGRYTDLGVGRIDSALIGARHEIFGVYLLIQQAGGKLQAFPGTVGRR